MIPSHQSRNYEATNYALITLQGLIHAYQILHNHHDAPNPVSDEALAKDTVLAMMGEVSKSLTDLRSMEWVGLGGKSDKLTPEQIARASGIKKGEEEGQ